MAEITKCKRDRGIFRQISRSQFHESFLADNGAQAGIIVVEAIKNAKPVNAIVDLQSVEGAEPVVRLDKALCHLRRTVSVGPSRLHTMVGGKPTTNATMQKSLQACE